MLFIDYTTGIISYEARRLSNRRNILWNKNSEIILLLDELKNRQTEVLQKIDRELFGLTIGKDDDPREGTQCTIFIGSLKVTCSGGVNAEGNLKELLFEEFKNYNPEIVIFKGDANVTDDELRQAAKDAKADILIYSEHTNKNCLSVMESSYILKSEYVGINSYINQSKIITSEQGKLESLRRNFFSKAVCTQICWDLFLKNKNDKKYCVKLLQTVISNSPYAEERVLAFEELIRYLVTNNSLPDEIKDCDLAFLKLINKQRNTQLTLKWMHKLKSILPNGKSKSAIDDALKNALLSLFSSGKLPDDFPAETYEFVFCLWLLNKFDEHGNAVKLIEHWGKGKSCEFYISALKYYKIRKENEKCRALSDEMIQKCPNIPFGYDFLADYNITMGDYNESLKNAKLAISCSPTNADYYVRVSKLYSLLKNASLAENYCSIAKSISDTIQCPLPTVTDSIVTPKPCCTPETYAKKSFNGKISVLHTVREGEVLGQIAEKYGIGLSELLKANGISENTKIFEGHVLIIFQGCNLEKIELQSKSLNDLVQYLKSTKLRNCDESDIKAELIEFNGNWNQLPARAKKNVWYIKRRCDLSKC
jgi:LysM repeat protein